MKRILFTLILIFSLVSLACSFSIGSPQAVRGSGSVVSETRSVSEFTEIEIAGSADVNVSFGETQSVVVEAEDNILPLIETTVRGGRLVINTRPNTSITTTRPIHVTITMKVLDTASIPGSGNIDIAGLQGGSVKFSLPGSGNITATGTTDTLNIDIGGSGNIVCTDLQAKSVTVTIGGSGNASVYASESLNVRVSGSGNVQYRGNPASVNKSISGSGSVNAVP
jgi:hypothetical protein